MHASPVLDPNGNAVFSAGGRHAWKTMEYRGYTVSLEWVISNTRRRAAPCMVIWASENIFIPGSSEKGMWAIGRRAISEFVGFDREGKCTGSASVHCMRECHEALPILGKDRNDRQAYMALIDTVVRFAPDLVLMPPTPVWMQAKEAPRPMWEVTATNKATGKTLSESEV
jgi:hypothetical protein